MVHFPSELWQQICYQCNTQSLKNLRLLSHAMNDAAARVLFKDIHVATLEDSLDNLSQIARHPTLRLYVHTILYLTDIMDTQYYEFRWWTGYVKIVSDAVKQFPKLTSIKTYEGRRRLVAHMKGLSYHDTSQIPLISRLQKLILYQDFWEESHLFSPATFQTARPMVCLIKALAQPQTAPQVCELDLESLPWCFWHTHRILSYLPNNDDFVEGAFRNLTTLRLNLCIGTDSPVQDLQNQMLAFLQVAYHLEDLKLHFRGVLSSNSGVQPLQCVSTIFAVATWPRLRKLDLRLCTSSVDSFVTFMQRHSGTLRTFRACAIGCTGGHWQTAFENIAPTMSLDSVILEYLRDKKINQILKAEARRLTLQAIQRSLQQEAGQSESADNDGYVSDWRTFDRNVARYLELGGRMGFPTWGETREHE